MSNKKGFSGLDDLSTDIDDIISENYKEAKNTSEQKTEYKEHKTTSNDNETEDIEKSKSTSSGTNNTSTITNNDSNNGSSIWIWWLLSVGIVVWIIIQSNSTNTSSGKTSYSSSSQQSYSSSIQSNDKNTHSLTIKTVPDDARVRILNIKPKYQDGIKLEKGKYHLEISKNGYETIKQWISLNQDMTYTAELNKIFQNSINSASFDCTQAISKVENMICSNDEISALDSNMARLYKKILDTAYDKEPIKLQQRNWIKVRNECNDYSCLKKIYKEHISKLELIKENISPMIDGNYKYISDTTDGGLSIKKIGNKIKFEIVTVNKRMGSICDLSGLAELNDMNAYYKDGEFEINIMFSNGNAKVSTLNSSHYCGVGVIMDGYYAIKN